MSKRKCSVEYCDRAHRAKGYCASHYNQARLGQPLAPFVKSLPPRERFLVKVQQETSGCWEWKASVNLDGYGAYFLEGKLMRAHRAAWKLFRGPIPSDMQVDHVCHNRACVNPQHLQLVTHRENMENQAGAHANSRSGVRGVWRYRSRWSAVVTSQGKKHHVGVFDTISEAESAVIAKRNELHTNNLLDRKAS